MTIQWYPGHMAKATRLMKEELKNVDIVLMMGDARAVKRSINRDFTKLVGQKKYCLVFNKSDLADESVNQRWKEQFRRQGTEAFFIDCVARKGLGELTFRLKAISEGFRFSREVRVMVTGIPNVGKSLFINTLAGRGAAQTGNRPGVTRAKQWIKIAGEFYLLDTPGVLPPKFETQEDGAVLAAIGSVKDTIIDREELALNILAFLCECYPQELMARYKLSQLDETPLTVYEAIGRNRGFKSKGGEIDYERTAYMILDEFRAGKIARISFDRPQREED